MSSLLHFGCSRVQSACEASCLMHGSVLHDAFRHIGSTGQCQDPGKVFKGKKMPGRMGGDRVTVQSLKILKVLCRDKSVMVEVARLHRVTYWFLFGSSW